MKTILYSLLISLVVFSNACNLKETKWLVFQNESFKIEYPDFLESDSTLNAMARMSYNNKIKEFYCLVIDEHKDTLAEFGFEDMTLDDYILIVKENHENLDLPFKILKQKNVIINGLNGFLMETEVDLTTTNNNKPTFTRGHQVVIEGKKGFYQIYVWCLKKDFDNNLPQINRIIGSFKEL
ncbi:MAG: hypothetical protein Q8K70_02830 [Bacteroidota bacterium]|nr:hypothetical protein [Bacteroidota bacterium]